MSIIAKREFFTQLFQKSLIISGLDRFAAGVYEKLAHGLFGSMFTSYDRENESFMNSGIGSAVCENTVIRKFLSPARQKIAKSVERSLIISLIGRMMSYLLSCQLRVYGYLFLSFGIYSSMLYLISLFLPIMEVQQLNFAVGIVMIVSALPLSVSKKTLSQSIYESVIASKIVFGIFGLRREQFRPNSSLKPKNRTNIAFIIGMLLGVSTYFISPVLIIGGVVALLAAYLILVSPECGVMAVLFLMPFLPTMALVAAVGYVTVCYLIKIMLGKRVFKFETVDLAVLMFIIIMGLGGIISINRATSIKSVMVFICFMIGYFLVVSLIRTREWLGRCVIAVLSSASLVSLIGIYQYLSGSLSNKWQDSTMFDISGRVTSTLENPNVLAEYLIMTIFFALSTFLCGKNSKGKFTGFCISGIIGVCLILTWSRGAWLGALIGAIIFIMIYHRRSIYLFVIGAASIPFLPFVLPDAIISRFTSIGNMADSSTSYRVYIWRASVNMLKDYFFTGIGVGEGAFRKIYPLYTLSGIEAAPHSHNLYLQIWLETGIIGLLIFLIFIFFYMQSHFTCYKMQLETQNRMYTCAGLCGIIAILVQGMTDYVWYNYRVFLMFWLIIGLSSAFVRLNRDEKEREKIVNHDGTAADIEISLDKK